MLIDEGSKIKIERTVTALQRVRLTRTLKLNEE